MRFTFFLFLLVLTSVCSFAQMSELKKADSIAELYPHHSLHDLKILSEKLTGGLTTNKEKFRAIFKWVCLNIESEPALAEQNLKNRSTLKGEELTKWTSEFGRRAMQVLVQQHKTVCTGYAYLVRELARHAGIPCEIVDGYGRTVRSNIGGEGFINHSWNVVQLDGVWYLCDPTWSAGAVTTVSRTYIPQFQECYFLADPSLFIRNHYPINPTWTLLKDPPSLELFLNAPLIYVNAFRYKVHPTLPATFRISAVKGEKISFGLAKEGADIPGTVKFMVGNGVARSNVPCGDAGYAVDHTFFRRGTFAVHFTVDNQYVASYEVTVK